MKVDVSVGWGVVRGVVAGVVSWVFDEVDIGVGDDVGEVLELEVGGKIVSINRRLDDMLILGIEKLLLSWLKNVTWVGSDVGGKVNRGDDKYVG